MVLNFDIIFSNEVAKYQTQKHLKEKYGRKIMYFGSYILINKVFFHWKALKGQNPSTEMCA